MTFNDIYEFPFRASEFSGWVYDAKDRFIFQFESHLKKEIKEKIISILNKKEKNDLKPTFSHGEMKGEIIASSENINIPFILIRGWGYLTGPGGLNLPTIDAAKVQDTLADYIVETLNKKII